VSRPGDFPRGLGRRAGVPSLAKSRAKPRLGWRRRLMDRANRLVAFPEPYRMLLVEVAQIELLIGQSDHLRKLLVMLRGAKLG
jgi:hypothetical protein